MADRSTGASVEAGDSPSERPPFGSWAAVYVLCCVLALVVMALLFWFSSHFNVRMLG